MGGWQRLDPGRLGPPQSEAQVSLIARGLSSRGAGAAAGLLWPWEWAGGRRRQGRPFEFLAFLVDAMFTCTSLHHLSVYLSIYLSSLIFSYIVVKYTLHKIYHFGHVKSAAQGH